MDEDLNLGELTLSSVDREVGRDNDNDTNSVCSSLSAGFSSGWFYNRDTSKFSDFNYLICSPGFSLVDTGGL